MIQQALNKLTKLTLLPEWWAKPHVNVLNYTNSPTTTHMRYYTSMCWSTQVVQQLPHKVPHVNVLKYTSSPTTTHTKDHTSVCWSTQTVQQPTQSTTRQHAEVHSPITTHTKYHMTTCWSTQEVQLLTQSTTCQCAEVHKQSNNHPHRVPHINVLKYKVQQLPTQSTTRQCTKVQQPPTRSLLQTSVFCSLYHYSHSGVLCFLFLLFSTLRTPSNYLAFTDFTWYDNYGNQIYSGLKPLSGLCQPQLFYSNFQHRGRAWVGKTQRRNFSSCPMESSQTLEPDFILLPFFLSFFS